MSKQRQLSAFDIKSWLRFCGLLAIAILPILSEQLAAHTIDLWILGSVAASALADLLRRFLTNYAK